MTTLIARLALVALLAGLMEPALVSGLALIASLARRRRGGCWHRPCRQQARYRQNRCCLAPHEGRTSCNRHGLLPRDRAVCPLGDALRGERPIFSPEPPRFLGALPTDPGSPHLPRGIVCPRAPEVKRRNRSRAEVRRGASSALSRRASNRTAPCSPAHERRNGQDRGGRLRRERRRSRGPRPGAHARGGAARRRLGSAIRATYGPAAPVV